ncbi:hypothetical protein OPV22_015359 [Ensete ventricosum]|uniref:Uncharacterized protein n=1 Tax=Ensete ventricosum TaxID=4639 RepID=A0AAV8R5B9_ENSVE|nr:hypothetical protein OPV22_015359 [Ensete ventricosum]
MERPIHRIRAAGSGDFGLGYSSEGRRSVGVIKEHEEEKGGDPFQGSTALAAVVVITPVWLVRTVFFQNEAELAVGRMHPNEDWMYPPKYLHHPSKIGVLNVTAGLDFHAELDDSAYILIWDKLFCFQCKEFILLSQEILSISWNTSGTGLPKDKFLMRMVRLGRDSHSVSIDQDSPDDVVG